MLDLEVVDSPDAVMVALDPLRASILELLVEPGSATTVAAALGLPRQKVNYHLHALESHGLVRAAGDRPRRGLVERLYAASARSYLLSPPPVGTDAADPRRVDRLSSRYLVAVAARVVREVTQLARSADAAALPLATMTLETEIRFRSAADRSAFTDDLAEAVATLVARYHDEQAADGRWHRLVVAAHPSPRPVGHATDPTAAQPDPNPEETP